MNTSPKQVDRVHTRLYLCTVLVGQSPRWCNAARPEIAVSQTLPLWVHCESYCVFHVELSTECGENGAGKNMVKG